MVPHFHTDQVVVPVRREPDEAEHTPYTARVAPAPRPFALIESDAPATVTGNDSLIAGEVLCAGRLLSSASCEFAVLVRRDGNLVIRRRRNHAAVWQASTGGNSGAFLEMRDDGDLCLFTPTGAKAWSTDTKGNPGAFGQLGDDGVLVVYSFYRERLWSTEPK